MAVLLTPPRVQFFDNNGDPLAGGKVNTYEAGTTTPKATYTNQGGATPNANPVILDSAGRASIWLDGSYKIVVTDANDVEITSDDNITSFNTSSTTLNDLLPSQTGNSGKALVTNGSSASWGYPGPSLAAFTDKILYGLTVTTNGSDAANDIDIAAGAAISDDGTTLMTLASSYTKQTDAAWAVGTNAGSLDTGAVSNTTYYVWLIHRTDTSVTDVLTSTSSSSPTMPSNYTKKKRIGAFHRASATNQPPYPVGTFVSANQTITAGGSLTLAHGLGIRPRNVGIELVCTSSEHNYSVGDIVHLPLVDSSGAASGLGASVVSDATNLNIRFGSATATFIVLNKSSGAVQSATNASWNARFIASP